MPPKPNKTLKTIIYRKDAEPSIVYSPKEQLLEIFVGSNPNAYELRKSISDAPWKEIEATDIELSSKDLSPSELEMAYEIIELKSYIFDKYKTNKRRKQINKIRIKYKNREIKFNKRAKLIQAVKFCRDIVSSNASEINPGAMETFARELSKTSPLIKVRCINAKEARKLGMGCLLAVGAESLATATEDFHPRLVVLEYQPKSKAKQHIALVGKGITFDTGGLCLKPNNYMLDMKSDMTGAAVVLSVFKAISSMQIPVKVTGIMALSENAFGGASYKPGDVLRAMNGKTVQVVDTDAEGRLVLADALSYASSIPDLSEIIDLATLTGSIVASLGEAAAGAMTNDQTLFQRLSQAFDSEGEKIWQMPLLEEYKPLLKSNIADFAHCSKRPDAIVAGLFLREFVGDKAWLHLDIAGMGFWENDGLWAYKGATGFAVRSLVKYLSSL